jgi:hypothetical protein
MTAEPVTPITPIYRNTLDRLAAGETLRGVPVDADLAGALFPADEKARGQEYHNRPIDKRHVAELARVIARGEYRPSQATAFLFNPELQLLEGYHRCLALQHPLAKGCSILVDMIPNVTDVRGGDEGLPVTLAHKLHKEGIAEPKLVARTVGKFAKLEAFPSTKPSALLDYYLEHKVEIDEHLAMAQRWLTDAAKSKWILAPDYLALTRAIAGKAYPQEIVDRFLHDAVRGSGPEGSPTLETFVHLSERQTKPKPMGSVKYVLKMLAKSITGKRVDVLRKMHKARAAHASATAAAA